MIRKTIAVILLLTLSSAVLTGCANNTDASGVCFAMDTVMSFTIYGKNRDAALAACQAEVYRLDALFSATDPRSDISRINAGAGEFVEVSDETAELIERSLSLSKTTDGAFDITVYALVECWGFISGDYRVPAADEITQLLGNTGSGTVEVQGGCVRIAGGQKIGLGAIAKGYLTDRIWSILESYEVSRAVISLGGNVLVLGDKPDKTAWRVGIEDPFTADGYFGVLSAADMAVVTSGGYQRYFEDDGKRYHHIFDPSNGYPSDSDLVSVTIAAKDGTLADALSTAFFVMGSTQAKRYYDNSDGFEMILVTKSKEVIISAGLRDVFTLPPQNGFTLTVTG